MSDFCTKDFEVDLADIAKKCHFDDSKECSCENGKSSCSEPSDLNLSPKELGKVGERAAVMFLERKGWEILEMNWCCFAGEADIIAVDDDTLCFIEVKTRSGANKGFPEEAVDAKKRDRYEKIAACYLQDCDFNFSHVRFDIISIMVLSPMKAFLRLHTNAFGEGM